MKQDHQHTDELDRLFPAFGDTSRLVISCHKADYSASRIARAVEDADAHLINLNVTDAPLRAGIYDLDPDRGFNTATGNSTVYVDLRVNRADPSPVIRSLERYGFEVCDTGSLPEGSYETMRERVNEILHILEM